MDTDTPKKHVGLDNLEGEIISGRYQIMRRVGKGGMGVVYLAQQTNLSRNVCIKVLNPALLDDEDAVNRFEREARGLSRLQHPNIVTIFDYGRDNDLAYIVMEYAQGETLGKFLKTHGALDLDTFLPIAVQTLKGIGEAHKLGLIHRDIKPANIILCELEGEQNFVKILDFGLAKLAQGSEDLTKEQQLVGSASYMAPETILTGTSDTRTDVYALGVMFYLMLSGKKPFTGSNDNAILYQHVNAIPSPVYTMINSSQNIPEPLCEVIDQCLSKDPTKRPQTALDLLNAFSFALDAPQICAGYSSMSLAKVDLQKASEEAETHCIETSVPVAAPDSSFASLPQIPVQETLSRSSLPVQPGPGETSRVSGMLDPLHESTNTYNTEQVAARNSKERKILTILVLCIATIVAIIIVAIIQHSSQTPNAGNTEQAQTNNVNLDEFYKLIDDDLAQENWLGAKKNVDLLSSKTSLDMPEVLQKVAEYNKEIEVGQKLDEARSKRDDEDFDRAIELYQELLRLDKSNTTAQNELDAVEALVAEMPTIHFELMDRSSYECYIDDVLIGIPPESRKVKVGEHSIRITRPGYVDWKKTQDLEARDVISYQVELISEEQAKAPAAPAPQKAKTSTKSKEEMRSGSSNPNTKKQGLIL